MKRNLMIIWASTLLAALISFSAAAATQTEEHPGFYTIKLHSEINEASWQMIHDALGEARKSGADYCILDINTYGGAVDAADSIRTAIIQFPLPVIAFINSQAASAGALISIACDSIYMRNGSSIGAATVVDQGGNVLPDKYQSFMRAMMRSTAESHGRKAIINGNDTSYIWHRDPALAEAMVSKDSVLSFTPSEAMANGYCEGMAESVEEVIRQILPRDSSYGNTEHRISPIKKILYFFMNPFLQGLLLMLIIGGIYFELQSPGIGFPLAAAVTGAVLYFLPLYLEGFVQNWELVLFIVGILLLFVEIFVLPGFGIAGISGSALVVITLAFAMVDNESLVLEGGMNLEPLIRPFAIVLVSVTVSLFLSIWLAGKLFSSQAFSHIALKTSLSSGKEGFVGVEKNALDALVGKTAAVATDLKPQGFVEMDGRRYAATLDFGFAAKGDKVEVFKHEGGRLYCRKPRI